MRSDDGRLANCIYIWLFLARVSQMVLNLAREFLLSAQLNFSVVLGHADGDVSDMRVIRFFDRPTGMGG